MRFSSFPPKELDIIATFSFFWAQMNNIIRITVAMWASAQQKSLLLS